MRAYEPLATSAGQHETVERTKSELAALTPVVDALSRANDDLEAVGTTVVLRLPLANSIR